MRKISITILSLSLLTVMAGAAIAPSLSNLEQYFNESSTTLIKLIVTISSLFIIPSTFIVSKLNRKYNYKPLIIIGLILYLIGGLGGAFVNNIYVLLIFRSILGIGVGFFMPFATSLVSDFFEGEKKATMMGMVSSSNNLGGIISLLLSGWLATISWRYSFGVYFLGFFVLLLVWIFLPNERKKTKKGTETMKSKKNPLPKSVFTVGISMFLLILAFYSIPANMSIYISQLNLGDSRVSSVVIAFISVSGFVAGFLYQKIKKQLNKMFLPVLLLLMAVGFLMIGTGTSMIMLSAGVFITGTGVGLFIPELYLKISNTVDKRSTVSAMAIVSSMMFLGQFFSPIFLDFIGERFGNGNIRFPYLFLSISILIFMIGSIFTTTLKKPKKLEQTLS
ncbi:MFS transporter [Chengkuizengella axinellae]|uniref:MFS transporter n=1 Tax=Chengkuizengella axinellae TaxID=3064388 RepID=A0ABT9J1G0_9BACL|nr:MFS transporter [Chengkuizengella sp. 2205SS18-9]MDP5275420.1 MFS transporter [Chengkuizengella sp. 2205SS18-9]